MTPELAKKIAFYSLGFMIGAGAGYAVGTFVFDNLLEEEEEILGEDDELTEEELEQVDTVIPEKKRDKKKKVDYGGMYQGKQKPNLDTLAKRVRESLDGEEEEATEVLDETPDPSKPYLISREQFEETLVKAHQKIYYHYYPEDDILTQAEDEMVITSDPDKFLGPDALDSFGKNEGDPDFVHIRNEILSADYEIQMIHGSYERAITSKKKEPVRRAHRKIDVDHPTKEEVDEE